MISRDLSLRVITGIPLAIAACWYFFLAPETAFIIITIAIGFIGNYEYTLMLNQKNIPVRLPVLWISSFLLFLSFWLHLKEQTTYLQYSLIANVALIAVFSIIQRSANNKLIIWYPLSLLWITVPLILLFLLRYKLIEGYGSILVFFLILVAAFNDIFAYFGGKKYGKHLLAPKISPKKTREGSFFGILGGLVSGMTLAYFFLLELFHIWELLLIIVVITVASQIGDLAESQVKRYCGVKDSSNLIPGHGGLLDRIDAYLLALPVFIGMLYILNIHMR